MVIEILRSPTVEAPLHLIHHTTPVSLLGKPVLRLKKAMQNGFASLEDTDGFRLLNLFAIST